MFFFLNVEKVPDVECGCLRGCSVHVRSPTDAASLMPGQWQQQEPVWVGEPARWGLPSPRLSFTLRAVTVLAVPSTLEWKIFVTPQWGHSTRLSWFRPGACLCQHLLLSVSAPPQKHRPWDKLDHAALCVGQVSQQCLPVCWPACLRILFVKNFFKDLSARSTVVA